MKIVIIGGTGFIGSRLAAKLRSEGHEVIAASPSSGVNAFTGQGLAEAVEGAYAVVDVSNSSSLDDRAVMHFFQTAGQHLLEAEAAAGIRHHLVLSVVGTDLLQESGYFRAKRVQENLIKESGIPYTIVRSTQFFEFIAVIAQSATRGSTVYLPSAWIQPVAADDVVDTLADLMAGVPLNTTVELAGPEKFRLDDLVRRYLVLNQDPRQIVLDLNATYFGASLSDHTLIPSVNSRIGSKRFDEWMSPMPKINSLL